MQKWCKYEWSEWVISTEAYGCKLPYEASSIYVSISSTEEEWVSPQLARQIAAALIEAADEIEGEK